MRLLLIFAVRESGGTLLVQGEKDHLVSDLQLPVGRHLHAKHAIRSARADADREAAFSRC